MRRRSGIVANSKSVTVPVPGARGDLRGEALSSEGTYRDLELLAALGPE